MDTYDVTRKIYENSFSGSDAEFNYWRSYTEEVDDPTQWREVDYKPFLDKFFTYVNTLGENYEPDHEDDGYHAYIELVNKIRHNLRIYVKFVSIFHKSVAQIKRDHKANATPEQQIITQVFNAAGCDLDAMIKPYNRIGALVKFEYESETVKSSFVSPYTYGLSGEFLKTGDPALNPFDVLWSVLDADVTWIYNYDQGYDDLDMIPSAFARRMVMESLRRLRNMFDDSFYPVVKAYNHRNLEYMDDEELQTETIDFTAWVDRSVNNPISEEVLEDIVSKSFYAIADSKSQVLLDGYLRSIGLSHEFA